MTVGVKPRHRIAWLALIPLCSCSFGSANEDEIRASAVYDEVVRWLVDDAGGATPEEPMAVFIEPRGEGSAISLDVQAELIDLTKDIANVRFLDERSEGLIDEDGTVVVKDEGILIRLGPVVEDDSHVLLDVDIWESEDTFREVRFELRRSGRTWSVQGPPDEINS
ncbi:MAG TPA: hypothetical protein VNO51_22155 [Ilumatobacteraceae bacterium]|nr:hypothetical protein [Ilumatobacteraceae bacterium]